MYQTAMSVLTHPTISQPKLPGNFPAIKRTRSPPDTCPERERAKRERKGDLDQYERLGGPLKLSKLVLLKRSRRIVEDVSSPPVSISLPDYEAISSQLPTSQTDSPTGNIAMPLQIMFGSVGEERLPTSQTDSPTGNIALQTMFAEDLDDEERTDITDIHQEVENDVRSYHDEEVAEARLKLILRIWRRHSSKKRQLRKQRQLAANAALNSPSLGPPIRHRKDRPSMFGEFDIDRVMSERYQKHERSWSRLNVSEVIVGELGRKNPEAKCHCWKIVLCSQMDNPAGEKLGQ
ncbi:SAC3 family protein B-like isoform X2 [Cornus florida]|uniref:SAC3 family protein B-like isoform X2 n=1 Tax=Cornus florida TaxID=4283 RepID=UPI0028A08A21|nr:SAC3 family protein B-like isoform X2 [Cornus florida]XP_059649330.1 SAC3 family protein B-like isoform X2 [Cornus florida]